MNQKELKELIEFLIEKDIAEFELERGDVKVRIKRGADHATAMPSQILAMPTPVLAAATPTASPAAPPAASTGAPKQESAEEAGLHEVKSPIVGTFYESPSPGSPPFVKAGDEIAAGQILCIIEAMKLMNEIEADVSGELIKRLVNNGQPVEYGQGLFLIRPKG
ncbi:MAG: acetyl-CoA carboxylase biotin carboxyl carrier protein [Acidobacteria bacterium]|nr:acetyl-CoA carboxylase biotin carboxyl carrier protein [Acidobacteriaceae bacterium]MBV9610091.1 acetyl-CoA carboxylase biotin carboxyl carrier protein [Acidobacteriota bacterium]